jgi:hypothetical protein
LALACIDPPRPNHPVLAALPDATWAQVPDWQGLTAGEQDFLAQVTIAVRNRRSQQTGRPFQSVAPADIVAVDGFPGVQFSAAGAEPLRALTVAARAHLLAADPGGAVALGTSYRSYEEQLRQWPLHLKRYFLRHRDELAAELRDGRYSDAAVCRFRDIAGKLYGFPGYSNHQSGKAVDFRTRVGAKGAWLYAGTDPANKAAWCATPLFQWLAVNARAYGFIQEDIDEPWHWVHDPVAAKDPARANLVAPSCSG